MLVGPTIRRRRLGADLRRMREERSLKIEDVASRLGVAPSTLSRIETGKAPTRTSYLRIMLDLYGVDDPARRQLMTEQAREGQRRGWWAPWGELLPVGYDGYLGLEAEASALRIFAGRFIPALLQVPEYAADLIEAARAELTEEQVRSLVAVQVRRQDILAGPAPVKLSVILDESALLRVPPELRARQLAQLLAVGASRAAELQVLRLSASHYPVPVGSFTIVSFADPGDADVLCTEGPRGQAILEDRGAEIRVLADIFGSLTSSAMTSEDTAAFIRELAS